MHQISPVGEFSKWPPIKVHENRKKCTDDVLRREFCSANYGVQHEFEGFFYEEGVPG